MKIKWPKMIIFEILILEFSNYRNFSWRVLSRLSIVVKFLLLFKNSSLSQKKIWKKFISHLSDFFLKSISFARVLNFFMKFCWNFQKFWSKFSPPPPSWRVLKKTLKAISDQPKILKLQQFGETHKSWIWQI